jgi:Putative adhesin
MMNGDTAMTTVPATRPPRAPARLPMTPGRWISLLIGVPIALALIGWTGFSIVTAIGQARYPVTGAIPLDNGQLVATMGGSDVTLHQDQARGSTARLAGTVQYSLVHPVFTVIGTAVNLDCRIPSGNCGLNATLDVPADTPVDLSTGGGNVQASGIQRDVTLNTAGGDVTLSGDGGNTDLSTGGGNVTAGDLGGIVNFSTAGGDVIVNDLVSPHVTLDTGGGNVTLVFTKAPAYLDITSAGGDITVVLPYSASTQYDVKYQTEGGNYSNTAPVNGAATAHKITVDSGGGNVNISEAS